MPINIEEIKKMPVEEKLKILDQLLDNIDEDMINEYVESEEDQILRERLEQYEKGEMTFHSWEEVKASIKENFKTHRRE
jgi:putative addiction module component (TIGR02574 family)